MMNLGAWNTQGLGKKPQEMMNEIEHQDMTVPTEPKQKCSVSNTRN